MQRFLTKLAVDLVEEDEVAATTVPVEGPIAVWSFDITTVDGRRFKVVVEEAW